ncbi:MAG TPA: RdgB/HAM1 family non-canonical purine NTP pyrophosphatase [Flavisolibacter sp.]|jgi:XTP/dITP diphosphohydrolase|nr:RdgB/HAM1 family non-canonical purine NTP pyrophosphatase [Flavisolibacter sp.]
MKIIFATNNQHKVDEIRSALPENFCIITLKEAGIDIDIPEPHETLQENAAEKARTIFNLTKTNCFSEDTGLEVFSLNNEPGVHSARYAGEQKSFDKNIDKLLSRLKGSGDRRARFRTLICLILDEQEYFFEGICDGKIIKERQGNQGFGYDPVFIPTGSAKTFAEMSIQEKNKFSHRKKAIDKLVTFLNDLGKTV